MAEPKVKNSYTGIYFRLGKDSRYYGSNFHKAMKDFNTTPREALLSWMKAAEEKIEDLKGMLRKEMDKAGASHSLSSLAWRVRLGLADRYGTNFKGANVLEHTGRLKREAIVARQLGGERRRPSEWSIRVGISNIHKSRLGVTAKGNNKTYAEVVELLHSPHTITVTKRQERFFHYLGIGMVAGTKLHTPEISFIPQFQKKAFQELSSHLKEKGFEKLGFKLGRV